MRTSDGDGGDSVIELDLERGESVTVRDDTVGPVREGESVGGDCVAVNEKVGVESEGLNQDSEAENVGDPVCIRDLVPVTVRELENDGVQLL